MKYLSVSCILLTSMALAQNPPPKKEMNKDEPVDVEKTAARIAENANKAGDRLKGKDTGTDTRKLQQDILQDIEALLRQAQQPPPPSPPMMDMNPMMPPPPMKEMNPMMNMNMGGMSGMMMNPMMNMGGGMAGMPKGMNMGMGSPPMPKPMGMGGNSGTMENKSNAGRRPKRDRKSESDAPQPMMPKGMNDPLPKDTMATPMAGTIDPKDNMGAKKDQPGEQFGKGAPRKDDSKFADLYKNVWGHLPDRLRQEMDLYYREQFMPRYSELLRQYYAAIAEQKQKGEGDR